MSEVDGVKAINKVTFGQRLKAYKRSKLSFLLAVLVLLSAIITVGVLGYLIFYILIKGIPNLSPDLFSLTYTSAHYDDSGSSDRSTAWYFLSYLYG